MIKKTVFMMAGLSAVGCTSVTVQPLDAAYNVKHICITENPKVIVDELVPVIAEGLSRHHIESTFIQSTVDNAIRSVDDQRYDHYFMGVTPAPDSCDYRLTYTARQSWDFTTYLCTADIEISDRRSVIARANYHLVGNGGLSLMKWQGVKTKIDPVMDELLQFYR
ncbi:MAG: hypothetical protein M8364_16570 [Methylobacter sp.]|uniref:hypothetical protein n=1 Tax=Methylobacter sp. TaxID=2051955 RepID=UPI0025829D04|nr:hypothetical protein [Methylobacter sp.]MCL7422506.1 hypothetical protein [Methylobacter sp.]